MLRMRRGMRAMFHPKRRNSTICFLSCIAAVLTCLILNAVLDKKDDDDKDKKKMVIPGIVFVLLIFA